MQGNRARGTDLKKTQPFRGVACVLRFATDARHDAVASQVLINRGLWRIGARRRPTAEEQQKATTARAEAAAAETEHKKVNTRV